VKRAFRLSFFQHDPPRDVRDEISFHLDMRTREFIAGGMPPDAAREAAAAAFGDIHRVEAECRDVRTSRDRERDRRESVRSIGHDVRFAIRTLRKRPGFTIAAIITLALGIGANTAIFSIINGVLLRPLPYSHGEQLVALRQPLVLTEVPNAGFSNPEVNDYRAQATSLTGIADYHSMPFILLGQDEPRRVQTGVVSANFFDVLGVKPILGRTFRPGEDQAGATPVLVLSHDFWRRAFGGDSSVIGRTFEMNDRIHTVIGVLPPITQYPGENDVYMPTSSCPFRSPPARMALRTYRGLNVIARMAPGVSVDRARTELTSVANGLHTEHPAEYPAARGFTITATSLGDELTGNARPTLFILLGTAGFVLLIACANVANLMLAQITRREREMAVRAALGAGRGRLVRQLITESTLLSLAGAAVGVLLAFVGLDVLVAFAARFTPRAAEITIDGPVLLFTLGVAVLTGVFFGVLPALPLAGRVMESLRGGAGGRSIGRSGRVRGALIVSQVAVAFTLLIGAGLMIRSIVALQQVNPGFDPEHVLTATIDLNWSKYTAPAQWRAFFDRLSADLASEPGVVRSAPALTFPLDGSGIGQASFNFVIEERPVAAGDPPLQGDYRVVGADYFATLDIPLVRGRRFTTADAPDAAQVVVISQQAARIFWPDVDPIGKRVSLDGGANWVTIVGIVGDVRQYGLDREPTPQIYRPFSQFPIRESTFLIRTTGEPAALGRRLQALVRAIDPQQPVANLRTLRELRGDSLAPPRLTMTLLAIFAALALVITATGLAGVIAFTVSQQTREIGIRMALGAAQGGVLRAILRQGLSMVALGLAIGIGGALALSRVMDGLLYGVGPSDPLTFIVVALVLIGVAIVACFVPARRATTIDPLIALRSE
jgi:putative ABC transport system permease protein